MPDSKKRFIVAALLLIVCLTKKTLVLSHGGHEETVVPPLLVISLDGFRYDYVDRITELLTKKGGDTTNHFVKLATGGVYAPKGIENVFVTKTFTNHYSLLTGLYEKSHGITGSSIFDEKINSTIELADPNTRLAHSDLFLGEPIWVTYAKQTGFKDLVGCYMWMSCDVSIGGHRLRRAVPFDTAATCLQMVDTAVTWVEGGVRLTIAYFWHPDRVGHTYGMISKEFNDTLLEMNDCVGSLLSRLTSSGFLPNRLNLLIVSDHGMVNLGPETVRIPDDLDLYQIQVSDYTYVVVRPVEGKLDQAKTVLAGLSDRVTVYKKSEVPARWHFGKWLEDHHLLIIADLSVKLVSSINGWEKDVAGHGYDNKYPEMRPIFFALGPSLHENYAVGNFRLVDVYSLMCLLVGLTPAPNDGSIDNARSLLRVAEHSVVPSFANAIIAGTLAFAAILVGFCLFVAHRRRMARVLASKQKLNGYSLDTLSISRNGSHRSGDQTRRPLMDCTSESEEDIDLLSDEVLQVVLSQSR